MSRVGAGDFLAVFTAALVGAAYSQIMARILRTPATVITLPTMIPLVPGRALYYTMSYALHEGIGKAAGWGTTTALESLAIASGMVVVLAIFTTSTSIIRQIRLRHK